MDILIVILIGAYVFYESFTAVNEMPKITLREFLGEFTNIYTMKYLLVGVYGLLIIYHSREITGWYVFLTTPAIFCVLERTIYRLKYHTIPVIHYLFNRLKFRKEHKQ